MRPRFIALVSFLAGLASGAQAAPYVVRGQVVTAEGALPGAAIRLIHQPPRAYVWSDDEPEHRVLEPIETDSGEHGRFEMAVDLAEVAAHDAHWLLEVSAPGLARRILEIPPYGRQARAGTTEELGGVLLSPGVLVRGRAVSEAPGDGPSGDSPLVGVRVSLWPYGGGTPRPWTATTAADGGFQIPDVPPGEYDAVLDLEGPPGGGQAERFAPCRLERRRVHALPATVGVGSGSRSRPTLRGCDWRRR